MKLSHVLAVIAAAEQAVAALASPEKRQAGNTITVDPTKTYQTMDGFGFSTAFQRANLITNMTDKVTQRKLLDLLFSNVTGAAFSMIRLGIGSSPDSSSDHMNTFEPTSPGSPSAAPNYQWDGKDSGQLFVAQQAVMYGVKTFYGDAWSPPGFMKTNNNENNGGSLCGTPGASCSSGDWRQAYANYLIQWASYYAAAGVNITHLGPMNEPEYSASYASASWNGNQAADFIKVLYKTIQGTNMSDHLGIACCESEGWGNQVQMMSSISSGGASSMLKACTSHTYTSGASGTINTKVPVWLSEQCDLNGGWTTAWYQNGGAGEGYTWANNIYNAIINNNVGGYLYWEAVQWPNPSTNEKIIQVAQSAPYDYVVSSRLWAFANWSRFVRPGAVRIGSTGGGNSVKTASFRNVDGTVAVVMISSSSGSTSVSVKVGGGFTPTTATGWVSDASHQCNSTAVTVGSDGTVSGTVNGRSITTFFLKGATAAASS